MNNPILTPPISGWYVRCPQSYGNKRSFTFITHHNQSVLGKQPEWDWQKSRHDWAVLALSAGPLPCHLSKKKIKKLYLKIRRLGVLLAFCFTFKPWSWVGIYTSAEGIWYFQKPFQQSSSWNPSVNMVSDIGMYLPNIDFFYLLTFQFFRLLKKNFNHVISWHGTHHHLPERPSFTRRCALCIIAVAGFGHLEGTAVSCAAKRTWTQQLEPQIEHVIIPRLVGGRVTPFRTSSNWANTFLPRFGTLVCQLRCE